MRIAAFTMAYNEEIFLRLWHHHYSSHFGVEHLYVLDHGSNDESTAFLKQNVVRIPRDKLDESVRAEAVQDFTNFLLKYYEVVIFTDADEMIVADPSRYPNLVSYLEHNRNDLIAPAGLALLHVDDVESSLDITKPILQQRSWARFQSLYSKPLITRRPVNWSAGFHSALASYAIEPDLYLFHLKAMDRTIAHGELRKRNAVAFSDDAIERGEDFQFRYNSEQLDGVYFFTKQKDLSNCRFFDPIDCEQISKMKDEKFVGLKESFGPLVRVPDRLRNCIPGVATETPAQEMPSFWRWIMGARR